MLFSKDTAARLCMVSRALRILWGFIYFSHQSWFSFFGQSYFPEVLRESYCSGASDKGVNASKAGKVNQYGRKWSRQQRCGGAAGVGRRIQQSHPSPPAGTGEPADSSPSHQFFHRQHPAAGFWTEKGRGRKPRGEPRDAGEPQQPRRTPDRACGEHRSSGGDLHSTHGHRREEARYSRRGATETPRGEWRPVPKLRLRQFPSQLEPIRFAAHAVASVGLLHQILGPAFFRLVAWVFTTPRARYNLNYPVTLTPDGLTDFPMAERANIHKKQPIYYKQK